MVSFILVFWYQIILRNICTSDRMCFSSSAIPCQPLGGRPPRRFQCKIGDKRSFKQTCCAERNRSDMTVYNHHLWHVPFRNGVFRNIPLNSVHSNKSLHIGHVVLPCHPHSITHSRWKACWHLRVHSEEEAVKSSKQIGHSPLP